jgi:hypothetical protein
MDKQQANHASASPGCFVCPGDTAVQHRYKQHQQSRIRIVPQLVMVQCTDRTYRDRVRCIHLGKRNAAPAKKRVADCWRDS